jgi:hypothetical protein
MPFLLLLDGKITVLGDDTIGEGLLLLCFLGGGRVVAVDVTVPHPTPSVPEESEEVRVGGSLKTEVGDNSSSRSNFPLFKLSNGQQLNISEDGKLLHLGRRLMKSFP